MILQSNKMMVTRAAAIIFDLWFFLAPRSYFSLMLIPQELATELGIAQTPTGRSRTLCDCLADLSYSAAHSVR